MVSATLASPRHSSTPGGHGEGLTPWRGRGWGAPQQPQERVFVQRGQWLFPELSEHPQTLTPHGLWRKPGEVRRSGAQQQPGHQAQPCPPFPQRWARGPGEEQDNTEIIQAAVLQKNICGVWQLEQFRGEPRRGWDSIRRPALPRQHPPPPPSSGEGSKGAAAQALYLQPL